MMALAGASIPASAQSVAERVTAVRDGTVELVFRSRPTVCGDGSGGTWTRRGGDAGAWYGDRTCVRGPVRVRLGRSGGETASVRTCVACRPQSDAQVVETTPDDAARYLLSTARAFGGRNADEAVTGAALADAQGEEPDFTRLVRDEAATMSARKQALFWLGQITESTRSIVELDGALRSPALREQYTFVLSQRRDEPAVDKLIDIARHDSDVNTRKKAMFWLGQMHDPKALQFFKDALRP
jgi:hypothetical protein